MTRAALLKALPLEWEGCGRGLSFAANLYAKEPERFDKTLRELTAKQAALEISVNRWAELEALANATG